MDYDSILKELYATEMHPFNLGLQPIQALLQKLGNPEQKLKCMHIAGSNGKGSVAAILQSLLVSAGYSVGLYTSPHLIKFNERIRINNTQISDEDIVRLYQKIKPLTKNQSFFEITTAMAFLYFAEQEPDFVIVEVGLGGRLDATNVINPLLSIITPISLEHREYLGDTIEEIAREKAGIIKQSVPLITSADGKALQEITNIAQERNAPIIQNLSIKTADNGTFAIGPHENLALPNLHGSFQKENAAVAVTTIEALKERGKVRYEQSAIYTGLKNVTWPGRFQFIEKNIVLDAAHNPHGIERLCQEIQTHKHSKLIVIFGISDDKEAKEMAEQIESAADTILITQADNPRAKKATETASFFSKKTSIINSPEMAISQAKQYAGPDDLILITGSVYLVGEILELYPENRP